MYFFGGYIVVMVVYFLIGFVDIDMDFVKYLVIFLCNGILIG